MGLDVILYWLRRVLKTNKKQSKILDLHMPLLDLTSVSKFNGYSFAKDCINSNRLLSVTIKAMFADLWMLEIHLAN